MKTTIRRNFHGELEAWTDIDLPEAGPRRFLRISTSKRYDKRLTTTATVNQWTEDGMGYVHAFGFGIRGDFSEKLESNAVRCTQKALEAQHTSCLILLEWGGLKERAIAHYAAATA